MSDHMDRYVIRALAREHFLDEWQRDGWQVDMTRGEVCVDDSWFPVESLPRILSNHIQSVRDAERNMKAQTYLKEAFGRQPRPDCCPPDGWCAEHAPVTDA